MPIKTPPTTPPVPRKRSPNSNRGLSPPWKPGFCPNPKGRPPTPKEFRDLARGYSVDSLEAVRKLATNKKVSPSTRVRAAEVVINRGYGQPKETIEATVDMTGSLDVALETLTDAQLAAIIAATAPGSQVSGTSAIEEATGKTSPAGVHAVGDSDSTSRAGDAVSDAPLGDAGSPPADDT